MVSLIDLDQAQDARFVCLADNEFHRILYRSCGKERVWDAIKKLDYNYDRLRVMTLPLVGSRIIEEHREGSVPVSRGVFQGFACTGENGMI